MRRTIPFFFVTLLMLAAPETASAHGGGPESIVSFGGIVNWFHFIATAFWLGGIVFWRAVVTPSLSATGQRSTRVMNVITVRFTHIVWWCIGLLALTGALTTWIHVPTAETIAGSTYGIILLLKLVIAAGMIVCNAVINIGLNRLAKQQNEHSSISSQTNSTIESRRLVSLASRASLVLAFLMMVSIAALTEFDRSSWSVTLNFLRQSSLTIWFGATAFVPLVLIPSLTEVGVERIARDGRLSRGLGILTGASAAVALTTTVLTLLKNIDSLSDLWGTGYGIVVSLELLILYSMVLVLLWNKITPPPRAKTAAPGSAVLATARMNQLKNLCSINLVLGLAALFFSSLSGALYRPKDAGLLDQIPMAVSGFSFDLIEPLGYVLAAAISVALIWYFGVVENKVSNQEANEDIP